MPLQWQIDNATYIYRYFTLNKFTPEATCAMLGNFEQESSLDPTIWQNGMVGRWHDFNVGFGIAQWSPGSKLKLWCAGRGISPYSLKSQCEFMYFEMQHPLGFYLPSCNKEIQPWKERYDDMSAQQFITSHESVSYLTWVFCSNFERAGEAFLAKRQSYADYWYSRLALRSSGSVPSSSYPPPSGASPSKGSYYPASSGGRYQIQPGNTLSGIAARFGVTVQDLCQWNGISNPNVIYAGRYIWITPHSPSPSEGGEIVITVQPGDTLWGIAQRYGVTVQDLCRWNDITNPNYIQAYSSLVIYPSASSSSNCITYTVQPGDTLWQIAQKYGVTVRQLCEWNDIANPNLIYPGRRLTIYTGGSSTSTELYTVQPGDTLWGIAQRYGVTVQDLCNWNRNVISDPNEIYPGEVIRV